MMQYMNGVVVFDRYSVDAIFGLICQYGWSELSDMFIYEEGRAREQTQEDKG